MIALRSYLDIQKLILNIRLIQIVLPYKWLSGVRLVVGRHVKWEWIQKILLNVSNCYLMQEQIQIQEILKGKLVFIPLAKQAEIEAYLYFWNMVRKLMQRQIEVQLRCTFVFTLAILNRLKNSLNSCQTQTQNTSKKHWMRN